jgi:lysophospholipase L1-like esterase
VRIRISNVYGRTPLRLTGATVGKAARGAAVRPGTLRRPRFGHARSTVVPVGRERFSDAVPLRVAPLDRLTVTLHFAEPTGPATFHEFTAATAYRAAGDRLFDETAGAYTKTALSWYYLSGIDVPRRHSHAVAVVGDSITDGVGARRDTDNRWPDELAERLDAAHRPIGVLNTGLSGNRLLNDSPCFGERLTARFERDVLDQSGVRTVIVLEGVNDIGAPLWIDPCVVPRPVVTADQMIEGYRTLIVPPTPAAPRSSAPRYCRSRAAATTANRENGPGPLSTGGCGRAASSTRSSISTRRSTTRQIRLGCARSTTAATASTRTTPATTR